MICVTWKTAVNAANKENGHAQIALSYTLGDAYTLRLLERYGKADRRYWVQNHFVSKIWLVFWLHAKATELGYRLSKSHVDIPIDLHTHYTSGVASMTYLKAVEAGCDIIDTAMSPFCNGYKPACNRSYG